MLAADLLQLRSDRGQDPVGRLPDHLGGQLLLAQVLEVDGFADRHRDLRAGHQVRSLGVRRQQLLRAPLPHGQDRSAGLETDPRGTGLAGHRPHVGVAGDGALGVDHDALTATDGLHGGGVRDGAPALALDGDLAGGGEEAPQESVLEEAGLREVARQPTVVVDDVGGRERVEVGDVVHRQDAATAGRDPLAVSPVVGRRRQEQGLDDADAEGEGPPSSLLQVPHCHPRRLLGR